MTGVRRAELADLRAVSDWLRSPDDCRRWVGTRLAFPVDLDALPQAIEYDACDSWVVEDEDRVVAFGQLVPKPSGRLHLARILVAPERRREGLGRRISRHLLEEALAREARAVSLNVVPGNEAALALYRGLGFVEARRPPDEPASSSLYLEHAP